MYSVPPHETSAGASSSNYRTPDPKSNNLYERLGVDKDATSAEIKKRFYDLTKTHHPDVGGDAENYQRIKESYELLMRVDKRKLYDSGMLSPDGKTNPAAALVGIAIGAGMGVIIMVGLSYVAGMRVVHVFLVYLFVTGIVGSRTIKRKGIKSLILTAFLCILANANWSSGCGLQVRERILGSGLATVEVVGPKNSTARVTTTQDGRAMGDAIDLPLSGPLDVTTVSVTVKDPLKPWVACALFRGGTTNIFRTTQCVSVAAAPLVVGGTIVTPEAGKN